ncbi:DUF1161 domain-containing protein [Variovorax sp. GB1P17]|uniref:DUF1161 domain-containing protein n=1 Tax=Variovorax sp. GB1P17 TaxID=3443740 RepID=UPI003F4616CD
MKLWLVSIALAALAGAAHSAENCEDLRTRIESSIAAAGVTRFTVTIVDANASANGQTVGSCELGSKKVMYERDVGPGSTAAPSAARPTAAPMLTECRDGTVSVGGDCKK